MYANSKNRKINFQSYIFRNDNISLGGLANKRCCRVMRSIALCPDGSRPKQLIRYHRQVRFF